MSLSTRSIALQGLGASVALLIAVQGFSPATPPTPPTPPSFSGGGYVSSPPKPKPKAPQRRTDVLVEAAGVAARGCVGTVTVRVSSQATPGRAPLPPAVRPSALPAEVLLTGVAAVGAVGEVAVWADDDGDVIAMFASLG